MNMKFDEGFIKIKNVPTNTLVIKDVFATSIDDFNPYTAGRDFIPFLLSFLKCEI